MRVIALDTHDGFEEGDVYDIPEHVAEKLIAKGLVKAGPVPQNKMAERHDDKRGPTSAVGAEQPLQLSPAAPAYPMPIVVPLNAGDSASLSREQIREVMAAPAIDTATNVPPLETNKPKRKSYYKPTGRPRGRPRKGA